MKAYVYACAVHDLIVNFIGQNPGGPQSQFQNSFGELGDIGDGGKLKYLHAMAGFCVCV